MQSAPMGPTGAAIENPIATPLTKKLNIDALFLLIERAGEFITETSSNSKQIGGRMGIPRQRKSLMNWAVLFALATSIVVAQTPVARALAAKAVALQRKGDFKGAVEEWTRLIELEPNLAGAYHNRGNAKDDLKDYDGAIADLTKALGLKATEGSVNADRDRANSHNSRAVAWLHKGNVAAALADYSKAIELNPANPEALANRASLRQRNGDLQGAIADFSQAIEMRPKNAEYFHARGRAREDLDDLDGAIEDFTQTLKLEPNHVKALNNRGNARVNKGEVEAGIADFNRALELDRQLGHVFYMNRALARSRQEDLKGARADLDEALKMAPKFARALLNRGAIRYEQGDLDGAISDFTAALEADRTMIAAGTARAIVKITKGDLAGARADLEKLIASPDCTGGKQDDARLLFWTTRARLGDEKPATRQLEEHFAKHGGLVGQIGQYLLGTISEETLLREAKKIETQRKGALAKAGYFVAIKKLVGGNKLGAAEALIAASSNPDPTFLWRGLTRAEMDAMAK